MDGPGGRLHKSVIETVLREMATDNVPPRATGWTMAGYRWQPNRRLTEKSVYEIGGVGLPPFEMFVHCLPEGT
eukprot:5404316-Heterocapsa_arctica.AAC.1